MKKMLSFLIILIMTLGFVINLFTILMGLAFYKKAPEGTFYYSIICDIINLIIYGILVKYKYNHFSYKNTKFGDRALVRTMVITAVMGPLAFTNDLTLFGTATFIITRFIPTNNQMDLLLKCDDWHLSMKAIEESKQ